MTIGLVPRRFRCCRNRAASGTRPLYASARAAATACTSASAYSMDAEPIFFDRAVFEVWTTPPVAGT
jgi:hypothetical protein